MKQQGGHSLRLSIEWKPGPQMCPRLHRLRTESNIVRNMYQFDSQTSDPHPSSILILSSHERGW